MSAPVRVVIFRDEDQWVAQCLEHDVCTQAPDLNTLQERMLATMEAEHECCRESGKEGLECLPRAPDRFFEMWGVRATTFDRTISGEGVRYELALVA